MAAKRVSRWRGEGISEMSAEMSSRRSVLDRVLSRVVPRPVFEVSPPPWELAADLWVLDRQLLHFGVARLPTRTTIIRLSNGTLVVVSPPPVLDSHTAEAIDSIGAVEYVLIPNSFHYLYAGEFAARYPTAKFLAAPGLRQRAPDLQYLQYLEELGRDPPQSWLGEIDYEVLGPVRGVSEVLIFHKSSGTLILTDLAFNMLRYPRLLDRIVWRLSGIPSGFGPGRTSRSLLLSDRVMASRSLRRALEWPISRVVVAHGEVISYDAKSQLARAFRRYLGGSPEA